MPGRVLIADDSPVVRLSVSKRVRAEGREVIDRDSAASASAVDAGDLACALLDLDLGDGFGTDVAARLLATHEGLPIAFFTSETTADVLARAADFGPVFAKPGGIDEAVAWVRKNSE